MFRWFALVSLVGCLGISTYYRRRARVEGETIPRGRERPLLIAGRALGALPMFGGMFTYLVNPRWMQWASLETPLWTRWVGVGLGLLAVPAAYWVFSSLGRNVSETVLTKAHHELVTHGPYRWIRHPLYAMGASLFLAVGLMAANWFILLFAVIAFIAIPLVVIPMEERALLAKFGDDYRDYMQRTGGMVPRVFGRR
jgi:protein-S-isoprenylcysteine O-methyltransferase Ste14